MKELAALNRLTRLNLNFTTITDAGLKELSTLTSLSALKLKGTRTTDEGVKELQKVLPKCQIEK